MGAILLTIVLVDLFAKTCSSDGGRRRAAESVRDRNVSLYRSVCHALFHYLGAAAMEGWQGIPNAEAGQASGVNTEQTMSTDTVKVWAAGVRLAYRYGKRCSFGYRY